jgi:hypothetical protein
VSGEQQTEAPGEPHSRELPPQGGWPSLRTSGGEIAASGRFPRAQLGASAPGSDTLPEGLRSGEPEQLGWSPLPPPPRASQM